MKGRIFAGVDLSAYPKNPTGLAWISLGERTVKATLVHEDSEILNAIKALRPTLVAIDSPLSLPREGAMRRVDREMVKLGLRVFPPLLPSMKPLTLRGIALAEKLKKMGLKVIEVHPLSTLKLLGFDKKSKHKLLQLLRDEDFSVEERKYSDHELDAISAAYTALLFFEGKAVEVKGDPWDTPIVIPRGGAPRRRT